MGNFTQVKKNPQKNVIQLANHHNFEGKNVCRF